MNASKEVGEASGEATGIGETMEGVMTTVDAMASAVDAVEAMVMAVEMREWLEVGRPETERTTAIHFFSRALAVQKLKVEVSNYSGYAFRNGFRCFNLPLYWPGRLPGLVQLLADCLLPHNSKAIQSGAMLSFKYSILALRTCAAYHAYGHELNQEITSHASDPLLRLVRETDCTEIRDQGVWLLGRLAWPWPACDEIDFTWVKVFLPLITDLVHKYAAISEPTEAEISSLNTAIKALTYVHKILHYDPHHQQQPTWEPDILEILPVLIGIFQEPGKRKKAQIRVGEFLVNLPMFLDGNSLLKSGVIGMLLETVRVGKEPTAILVKALKAIDASMYHNTGAEVLKMGALGVFHLVLKRPNDRFKNHTLWISVIQYLQAITPVWVEAVLSEEGLLELVLELALGMDLSEETKEYHNCIIYLLQSVIEQCSEGQMRQLILKGPLFHLLHRYLSREYDDQSEVLRFLSMVRECLARTSAADQRILRLLLDDTGITDDIRRISLAGTKEHQKWLAGHILDTYLKDPLPPRTPHNLPSIIYTRNVPF